MSTYIEVQNRVNNDYLNRSTFASETKRAIQAAIRSYERQRWDFNETSTALTTASSVSFVTVPTNFLILDDLRAVIAGESLDLNRRSPQFIRDMNTATTFGEPTDYAIYQRRFEFFPIPNSAYSLPCYYLKSLTLLSADSDTNAWIQGGMEDVIVYHAAKVMWSSVLRNDGEASKMAQLEREALNRMDSYNQQFRSGKLKATSF